MCHGTLAVLSVYNLLILGCVEPFSYLLHSTTPPSMLSLTYTLEFQQGPLTDLCLGSLGPEPEGKPGTGIWA